MNVYDYAANDPINLVDPSGLLPGDQRGGQSQGFYADILTDPTASTAAKVAAAVGGAFASLWTPCTSKATFTVLVTAATLGGGSAVAAEEVAVEAAESGEATTALSAYRTTTEGETFLHYGYAEHAANFEGGLRPGGFATSIDGLSGAEAQSGLALPHATPPNAVYTVTPEPGTWIRANPVTAPQFGQPGGLPEYQFPFGTGPGTVSSPTSIF